MEFYSAMKNNEILFTSIWRELENIILSEVSQAQKAKSHAKVRTHTGETGKGKET
jgi:hypothetical protein